MKCFGNPDVYIKWLILLKLYIIILFFTIYHFIGSFVRFYNCGIFNSDHASQEVVEFRGE